MARDDTELYRLTHNYGLRLQRSWQHELRVPSNDVPWWARAAIFSLFAFTPAVAVAFGWHIPIQLTFLCGFVGGVLAVEV